jgi:hypothetical protein
MTQNRKHDINIKEIVDRLAGGHGLGDNTLKGELLLLEVLVVGVLNLELGHGVRESGLNLLAGSTLELQAHGGVRDDLLNAGDVRLELLASLVLLGESVVSGLELLSVGNGLLNVGSGELSNGVGDGDVGGTSGGLLGGGDLQDSVGVNLEDDLEDGLTSLHGRDGGKGELSEGGVVLAVNTLSLEDGELNSGLVVGNSGEGALLQGGDSGSTGNDGGEDVTLHGNSEGEGADIEQEKVSGLLRGGLSGKDTGLDGGSVGNGLIGVNGLLELLSVEKVGKHLLDLGDTGGSSDKDNLVDLVLGDTRVLKNLLNGSNGVLEEGGVDVLETGTGDGGVEVLTSGEGVDLNGGLGDGREGTLGTLTGGTETTEGTGVVGDVLLGLALELSLEVLEKGSVEVLSSQVGVSGGSLDGENTTY